jgi:hypothetical protein
MTKCKHSPPGIGHITIGGKPICSLRARDKDRPGKAVWQCEYDSAAKAARAITKMRPLFHSRAKIEYVRDGCPRHKYTEIAGPHALCSRRRLAAWVKKEGKKHRGSVGWCIARDLGII